MKHMAIQYFQNLHTNDPGVEPSGVLEFVVPPIDEDTNFDLCKGSRMRKLLMLCSKSDR
jgi:hypothetical protein